MQTVMKSPHDMIGIHAAASAQSANARHEVHESDRWNVFRDFLEDIEVHIRSKPAYRYEDLSQHRARVRQLFGMPQ